MSEGNNVAIARRLIGAFNRRDVDSVRADLHSDVELHEWQEAPGARTYRGPEGIRAALDSWFETWAWMQIEIEDLLEVGDDRVLVTLHQRAKGSGSGIEVELRSFNVYTFRDGKVADMRLFTRRKPALEAAGLTPNHEEPKP